LALHCCPAGPGFPSHGAIARDGRNPMESDSQERMMLMEVAGGRTVILFNRYL